MRYFAVAEEMLEEEEEEEAEGEAEGVGEGGVVVEGHSEGPLGSLSKWIAPFSASSQPGYLTLSSVLYLFALSFSLFIIILMGSSSS